MIVIDASPLNKMQRGILTAVCVPVTPSVFVTVCSKKVITEYLNALKVKCTLYCEAKNTIFKVDDNP